MREAHWFILQITRKLSNPALLKYLTSKKERTLIQKNVLEDLNGASAAHSS